MSGGVRAWLGRMLGARQPAMQVGALCLDPAHGTVLLITSRGTGRWIIPKGWPMPGRSLGEAALQEAWEEGGVHGRIERPELGRYTYDKIQQRGFAIPVEVRVFAVLVDGLADVFPEGGQRQRQWFSPEAAAARVAEPGLAALIRAGLR